MTATQYRLRTLLIAMFGVAVISLAIRAPSLRWSAGLFVVLLLIWLTSALVAVYCRGQTQAMAIGFCIFSFGYLTVERFFWEDNPTDLELPTTNVIRWSFEKFGNDQLDFGAAMDVDEFAARFDAYRGICIAALSFLVGVLGGAIAQLLERSTKSRLGQ